MKVETFHDLIDWTRRLHNRLSQCLVDSKQAGHDDLTRALMDYLAEHESRIEKMVGRFENQADDKALQTYVYDYLSHQPIEIHPGREGDFSGLDAEGIRREVFAFHQQVMELYRSLIGKAETAEAYSLLESLLDMEKHEAMRLAHQTGRLYDL